MNWKEFDAVDVITDVSDEDCSRELRADDFKFNEEVNSLPVLLRNCNYD